MTCEGSRGWSRSCSHAGELEPHRGLRGCKFEIRLVWRLLVVVAVVAAAIVGRLLVVVDVVDALVGRLLVVVAVVVAALVWVVG